MFGTALYAHVILQSPEKRVLQPCAESCGESQTELWLAVLGKKNSSVICLLVLFFPSRPKRLGMTLLRPPVTGRD